MQASELRIGNYFKAVGESWPQEIQGTFRKLTSHDIFNIDTLDCEGFEFVPLTPDILEKAGFKNHSGIWTIAFQQGLTPFRLYEEYDDVSRRKYYIYQEHHIEKRVLFDLHQLQNLYFAIKGEELEISL